MFFIFRNSLDLLFLQSIHDLICVSGNGSAFGTHNWDGSRRFFLGRWCRGACWLWRVQWIDLHELKMREANFWRGNVEMHLILEHPEPPKWDSYLLEKWPNQCRKVMRHGFQQPQMDWTWLKNRMFGAGSNDLLLVTCWRSPLLLDLWAMVGCRRLQRALNLPTFIWRAGQSCTATDSLWSHGWPWLGGLVCFFLDFFRLW